MKSGLLLPHRYKLLGWYILIPSTVLGLILVFTGFESLAIETKVFALAYGQIFEDNKYFTVIQHNITPTITGILFITGALLVSFSKEKVEDEFMLRLRQTSLLWAVLVNYILLLFCFLFIYGMDFLHVMIYNMFTIPVIFITRFHYILYKSSKEIANEEYHQSTASY
jgi:hypothetical protein